jgi:hypothetical protein
VNLEQVWAAVSRTLELAPDAFVIFPYERLRRVLPAEHHVMRLGRLGTQVYGAWPELTGDSVTYRPVPGAQLATLAVPPSYEAALRFDRDRLLGLFEVLTRRRPQSADAFEGLTAVLEARDEINGTPSGRYSALTALDRARMLSTEPTQRLRLAIVDMRLHLKLGDFARSAALADSLLRAHRDPPAAEAELLAGVAAYAGHAGMAARFGRIAGPAMSPEPLADVPAAAEAVTALLMRTALGVCDDSTQVLVRSVERILAGYVDPVQRAAVRERLLERSLMLAAPCTGGQSALQISTPRTSIVRVEQLVARGEVARARRVMDSLNVVRRPERPGAMSLDYILLESWAAEAYGDARGAAERLDIALSALPALSPYILTEPVMAASVGRTMAFRADLAQRMNDPATAAMWASRVLTLWAHADDNLSPVVRRMRLLAGHQPMS